MGSDLNTFVEVSTTLATAQTPVVQSFDVGIVAAYHTQYASRLKLYSTSGLLAALVADGFTTSSPVYLAAEAYSEAPNAPAQFGVGRRVLPPTQILNLVLTDGQVGDAYQFIITNPLGVATTINYTNVVNPGKVLPTAGSTLTGDVTLVPGSKTVTFASAQTLTAGNILKFSVQPGVAYTVAASTSAATTATLTTPYSGTASATSTIVVGDVTTVTNGSTAVTFGQSQTMAAGSILTFAGQPGVYYSLASASSSTAGTLSTPFTGTTGTYATTYNTPLAGSGGGFDVINGSSSVATTSSQVAAIAPGDSVQFSSQLGTYYVVSGVTSSVITLTTPYSGVTTASAYAVLVCQVSTAATYITYLLNLLANIGTAAAINGTGSFPTTVQITQSVAGNLNNISQWRASGFRGAADAVPGAGNIQLQDVTVDPGIQSDLVAIVAANQLGFYGISLDSNSQAEIEAAASFVEAQGGGKFLFANTSDYENGNSSFTTDLFSELQTSSYEQTLCQQNNQELLCYAGAATMGQFLAMNPGSYEFPYKNLPGVPADNDTTLIAAERSAINTMSASEPGTGGKNGNYYVDADGIFTIWPGTTPSGQFADISIGIAWLNVTIQAAVVTALASLPKVPLDNFGIGLVGDAILAVLNLAATPQYDFILPNGADKTRPIVVTVPDVSSLTEAQRATRNVSGITWSAGLTGAIETAVVNGQLIP